MMSSNTIDSNLNAALNPATTNPDKVKDTADRSNQQVKTTAPDQAPEKKTAQTDQVLLTPLAQRLKEIEKSLAQQPAVNTEKVEQVKQQIASNEYSINPERIAERLIGIDKLLK